MNIESSTRAVIVCIIGLMALLHTLLSKTIFADVYVTKEKKARENIFAAESCIACSWYFVFDKFAQFRSYPKNEARIEATFRFRWILHGSQLSSGWCFLHNLRFKSAVLSSLRMWIALRYEKKIFKLILSIFYEFKSLVWEHFACSSIFCHSPNRLGTLHGIWFLANIH